MPRYYEPSPKNCYFCQEKIKNIDYKEIKILSKFISHHGRIMSRGRTGTCARHQRKLASAIKRARFLALLPYVVR